LTRGVQDADLQLLEVGSAVPDFSMIDLIDGQTNRFASLRGQPVMVVFWAAWDPRSRAAMATLQRKLPEFPREIQPRVIAINLDHDQAEALDYVASRDWGWHAPPVDRRRGVRGLPHPPSARRVPDRRQRPPAQIRRPRLA
jgi:thiol-disulfide isomerase/thioredoxin